MDASTGSGVGVLHGGGDVKGRRAQRYHDKALCKKRR